MRWHYLYPKNKNIMKSKSKRKLSEQVIKEAFEKFSNLGSCLSGGKDSLLMTKLILDVVKENGYEQPTFLLCDPIPFKENENFCKKLEKYFGIKKSVYYTKLLKKKYLKNAKPFGLDKKNCCYWLKIKPLEDFIKKFKIDGLFVAIRWDEHEERAKEKYFSRKRKPIPHTRIHPILHWTWLDVWKFIKRQNLPFNPLYKKGYTSLGCKVCTSIVKQDGFKDIDEIIKFIKSKRVKEREGRDIDKELVMERLRALGYF